VRVSGTQLKEGFMGSDISYGDVLDSKALAAMYAVAVEGKEDVDGRPCWILGLTAVVKDAPYDKRRMWVDAERFIALKEEMSSKSGLPLKSYAVTDVVSSGGRWYAKRFEMKDARKKDSLSVLEISDMQFDIKLDSAVFSLKELKK
jgi:outer membrane lipoprotein-sorting protein